MCIVGGEISGLVCLILECPGEMKVFHLFIYVVLQCLTEVYEFSMIYLLSMMKDEECS